MSRQRLARYLFSLIPFLLGLAQLASAKAGNKYPLELDAFYGRGTSAPGTNIGGVGGEVFIYKGLAGDGDVVTTIGNSDNRITIGSAGLSYHFFCCRADRRIEPFAGAGFSYLAGDVNTHGVVYPYSTGQDRSGPNFNQGLIVWPVKHVGARFEIREYRFFVSYGALENVVPGGHFVEFRIGVALR